MRSGSLPRLGGKHGHGARLSGCTTHSKWMPSCADSMRWDGGACGCMRVACGDGVSAPQEIASGRLAVRKDRNLLADVGQRQLVLDMLLSYRPEWLRLALETVFGEVIAEHTSIKAFLKHRLLAFDDLRAYHKSTISGDRSAACVADANQAVLRRFLRLVYFMDMAHAEGILGDEQSVGNAARCLFRKAAAYKASPAVLVEFGSQFLAAEGNIVRHLRLFGFEVTYTQGLLEEWDFHVASLASDLRDGVLLCRLAEVLAKLPPLRLVRDCRVPAISRLQKRHNVRVAFRVLCTANSRLAELVGGDCGAATSTSGSGSGASQFHAQPRLSLASTATSGRRRVGGHARSGGGGASRGSITSRTGATIRADDVVDGHREKTLALLWAIVAQWSLPSLVPHAKLAQEIADVCSTSAAARAMLATYVDDNDATVTGAGVDSAAGASLASRVDAALQSFFGDGDSAGSGDASSSANPTAILLRWVRAVCGVYSHRVANLSTAVADGRALCLLIHYYHPQLLPMEHIRPTTASLVATTGLADVDDWAPQLRDGVGAREYEAAIAGERSNFVLVKKCVAALGCVPAMLPSECDSSNPPESQTMTLFLAYLCTRLMDSGTEVRAAAVLQRVWRRFSAVRRAKLESQAQRQQRLAIEARAAEAAAAHICELRTRSVTAIASMVRRYLAVRSYSTTVSAVVTVQCAVRCYIARRAFTGVLNQHESATKLASVARGFLARRELAVRHSASTVITSMVRRYLAVRTFAATINAAVVLQRWAVALRLARLSAQYSVSAIVVQRWVRQLQAVRSARRNMRCLRRRVVAMQSLVRTWLSRRATTARVLQRCARGFIVRQRVACLRDAVLSLQSRWRAMSVRKRTRRAVRAAARRIAAANAAAAAAPQLTLGRRTRAALDVVLGSRQLTLILQACETLEVSTRLSHVCCECFARCNAAPVIISLLRSLNRSKPHQELVRLSLAVLHNVATVPSAFDAVCAAVEGADVMVDILQMFRDIPDIAASVLRLLLLLTNSDEFRASMMPGSAGGRTSTRSAGASSIARLQAIAKIVARKVGSGSSSASVSRRPAATGRRIRGDGGNKWAVTSTLLGRLLSRIRPANAGRGAGSSRRRA